jgi:hypothetical protein
MWIACVQPSMRALAADAGPRMLGRYSIVRGMPASALPQGTRQDTRKHTRHVLRPTEALVEAYLGQLDDDEAFARFREAYLDVLETRWRESTTPFETLAREAERADVWLGCNCPTAKNPNVLRCHTTLALAFMKARFPELPVAIVEGSRPS